MCDWFPLGQVLGGQVPNSLKPGVPKPSKVTADYLNLIQGYAQGEGTIANTEFKYKPQFINATVSGMNQVAPNYLNLYGQGAGAAAQVQGGANAYMRGSNVNDLNQLGPGAMAALRGGNPEQTALLGQQRALAQQGLQGSQNPLLGQLGDSAATQLAAGSRLDPGAVNQITQATRGDWANRGLGDSNPAQLSEAMNLYGAGQQELAQRQNFGLGVNNAQQADQAQRQDYALRVSDQGFQQESMPWLSLLNQQSGAPDAGMQLAGQSATIANSAGPTLIQPGQSYDAFNTAYNAQAAAKIAASNNQAAVAGGLMSY